MFSFYPDKIIPFGDDCNINGPADVSSSIDIFLLKEVKFTSDSAIAASSFLGSAETTRITGFT